MKIVRIGEKLINRDKLYSIISEIINRRSTGATQAEVASQLGLERSFVSRLEGLAQVRFGKRLALVGFPVKNQDEIAKLADEHGFDEVFLLSQQERSDFVARQPGAVFFNDILELIAKLKEFDTVVVLASDKRIEMIGKVLDKDVIGIEIGRSPIDEDIYVDIKELSAMLMQIENDGEKIERGRKRKFRVFKKRSYRRIEPA